MKKRVISIIVILAMIISLVPAMGITASADGSYGVSSYVINPIFDYESVSAAGSFIRSGLTSSNPIFSDIQDELLKKGFVFPSVSEPLTPLGRWQQNVDVLYSKVGYGQRSLSDINLKINQLNNVLRDIDSRTYFVSGSEFANGLSYLFPSVSLRSSWISLNTETRLIDGVSTVILRPYFNLTTAIGFWLVDSHGGFPYAVVEHTDTSTVSYGYFNKNAAVVNDTGLVSVSDLSTLALEYPYQGQIKTKVIQSGDYYYIGHVVGSTTIVLCKTVDGVNYAVHANYERPQIPTTVTDTGFNPIIMGNYALDFINPAADINYYLASQIEFQNAANNVRTADFNIDVISTDGTVNSYSALSYGSLSGSFVLDRQKQSMTMPSNSLWYYKLPANVADLFAVGNKQLNIPYQYAGTSPSTGFDCSGLVKYVFREAGVYNFGDINANQIYNSCSKISFNEAMPGDLVAFTNSGDLPTAEKTHIGIYAGAGMMLVAPRTGDVVKYQAVNELAGRNPSYCRVPGVNTADRNLLVLRNSDAYAAGDSFNYFTDGNDNIFNQGDTTNTQFIDYGDRTVINISGGDGFSQAGGDAITLYLDDLIYDESTKTYSSMSHSAYELKSGDTYVTVNYNYEYSFYVDYTSITYIGTSADANETYNFYYELPDGRSSADLSGEDLLALNTQIDVIPYSRSSDDTSLRSLYHFNGNTADSSYWNLQTSFTWNDGASITYLDAGQNFQGALYLDELNHDFTITLPSSLGSGDFTFEFRYYQSYTAAPQTDSYIQFGTNTLLQFDGAHYKNASGTTITDTGIGNWNALCLMRSEGILYFFVNGVPYSLGSNSSVLPADITFHFGSSQQTYKQIDELRVVNRAVYSTSGYTPASMQFDTNLSLVLPGTATPVADEYWDIDITNHNILSDYNCDYFVSSHGLPSVVSLPSYGSDYPFSLRSLPQDSYLDSGRTAWCQTYFPSGVYFTYYPGFSYSLTDNGCSFLGQYDSNRIITGVDYFLCRSGSLMFPLYDATFSGSSLSSSYSVLCSASESYTFSCVFSDGSIFSSVVPPSSSLVSSLSKPSSIILYRYSLGTSHGYSFDLFISCYSNSRLYRTVLCMSSTVNSDPQSFIYLALEEGEESTVSAEYVTSIVPIETSQLNTPTLAVRTDIDITSWNIGGVRPSIPEKGMAWALVEDGIITSLQVYDGQGWTNVDGRIWTGQRFVPLGSYNVLTMNDLLDIIGNSPGYTPIYTENGFWKWLQDAWKDMITLLTEIRDRLSGDGSQDDDGGGGHWWNDDADSDSDTDDGGLLDLFKTVLRGLIKVGNGILGLAFDGLESLVDWIGGIGDFFGYYSADSPNNIWQVPVEVTPTP